MVTGRSDSCQRHFLLSTPHFCSFTLGILLCCCLTFRSLHFTLSIVNDIKFVQKCCCAVWEIFFLFVVRFRPQKSLVNHIKCPDLVKSKSYFYLQGFLLSDNFLIVQCNSVFFIDFPYRYLISCSVLLHLLPSFHLCQLISHLVTFCVGSSQFFVSCCQFYTSFVIILISFCYIIFFSIGYIGKFKPSLSHTITSQNVFDFVKRTLTMNIRLL